MAKHHEYGAEAEELLSEVQSNSSHALRYTNCRHYLILLLTSCLSAVFGLVVGSNLSSQDLNRICFGQTSKRSPLLRDIDISWHEVSFNGSLLKENIYRQAAGPDVDAAWEALGVNYNSVLIPSDAAASVGLSANQVKAQAKYGGGYVANVEGLHHLHCLNLLRQALYWNVEYYRARGGGPFENDDFIARQLIVSTFSDNSYCAALTWA